MGVPLDAPQCTCCLTQKSPLIHMQRHSGIHPHPVMSVCMYIYIYICMYFYVLHVNTQNCVFSLSLYKYIYIYIYTHGCGSKPSLVAGHPSVTNLCRGPSVANPCRGPLCRVLKSGRGLSRRGLSQNTPVCYKPLSRNGRPSPFQGQCF